MRFDELELEQILKNNPALKVQKSKVDKLDGNEYYALQNEKITVNKYKNKKTKVDGILFDSAKEADYYLVLKTWLFVGEIIGFCRQPEFILQEGNSEMAPIKYIADFIVWYSDGTVQVVDVKASESFKTEVYKIKAKMFKAKFPKLVLIEKY